MNSEIWRDFAEQLAADYQVTCIDLPGHGRSEKLSPFTLASVCEVLAESTVNKPCCWLGWSLGATIALAMAKRFPERCHSLILLAGSPRFIQASDWPGVNPQVFKAFTASLKADSLTTVQRFFSLQLGINHYQKLMADVNYRVPDEGTLFEALKILQQSDLRGALAHLKLPVSVILGANDSLIPVAAGQRMQALHPGLELNTIDSAGHAPFLTHPKEVLSIIKRFLDQQ